jgi:hypothetical protein
MAGSDDSNSWRNCACCTFFGAATGDYQGALWFAAAGLVLVLVIGAGWLLLAGAQSAEGLGVELIVAGVFLVWLHYEIKARREIAAEEAAKKAQQLSTAEC